MSVLRASPRFDEPSVFTATALLREARPDLVTPRLALARLLAARGDARESGSLVDALLREDPSLGEARGALLAVPSPPRKP